MSTLYRNDETGLEKSSLEQLHQITTVIASYIPPVTIGMIESSSKKENKTLEYSRSPVYPIPYVYRYNPRSRLCKTALSMTHTKDILTELSDGLSFDTPNLTQVCVSFFRFEFR
jgi:hypothetical protein